MVPGQPPPFAALSSAPLFGFESALHYLTAVCEKHLANDMLGVGDDFRGWHNYLEAPLTYCGLLSLLLLPQVFSQAPRRHLIIFILFLAGMLIPIVFPWFRYLFWLFQGDYYRILSLFSILGLITLSMMVFSRYLRGGALNLWLLAATTIVLVGILYWPLGELQNLINGALKQQATIFLVSYGVLLAAGQFTRRQTWAAWIVVGLVAVELIQFNYPTVSSRKTVSKHELKERTGYNDETVDAVRDIKAGDTSFFRITKLLHRRPARGPV